MKGKLATYSFLGRSAWFALAILLVVCCGPVKKFIEVKYASKSLTTLPASSENYKLKTCYREKHEVTSFTQATVHQSPAADLTIYLAAAFCLSLLLLKENSFPELRLTPSTDLQGIPLYLRIRKLQV